MKFSLNYASKFILCVCALVCALAVVGKVLFPLPGSEMLPGIPSFLPIFFEVLIVTLVICRRWRLAAWLIVGFAAASILTTLLNWSVPCGCFGRVVQLTGATRLIVAGLLGAFGCFALVFAESAAESRAA